MKTILFVPTIILSAGLATGCASNSRVDEMQAEIDSLKTQVTDTSRDAADAKAMANDALMKAEAAEATAQDTNSKLNRMFKHSMMK
jgi:outer membrane murein-binding lipoprotein Lpp